jgi:hypothetical protein
VLYQLSYTRVSFCVCKYNNSIQITYTFFALRIHASKLNLKKVINNLSKKNPAELPTGFFAEREGFEPPVPLGTTVFKTAAIDHSAISPGATKVELFFIPQKPFS